MGLLVDNKSSVTVDIYLNDSKKASVPKLSRHHVNGIPNHLMGLKIETDKSNKKPVYIEFKRSTDKDGNITHIDGEIGHPDG